MDKNLIKNVEKMDFTDPKTKVVVLGLMEMMYETIITLQKEVQELRNEINKLKGEKGKPNIKENIKKNSNPIEKNPPKKWKKGSKNIKIDREEIVRLDRSSLPNDVVFKGYETKIIQNMIIKTDNVLYKREVYYSPESNMRYTAELDAGLKDTSFGPELKAHILTMYFEYRMTENLIHSFLTGIGISISEGEISNLLIETKSDVFTTEKEEILISGAECSKGINIDDSGFRENGKNKYINIICSSLFSFFIVNDNKKAITIEKVFQNKGINGSKIPIICDDAPQWKILSKLIQLCWVHEERHYRKLIPVLSAHKKEVEVKRSQIWDFYCGLKAYKKKPSIKDKNLLSDMFDKIFNVSSNYSKLNNRLKLTYEKKEELLLVLDYPEIDIHNNLSENGIRPAVIKRKISNGTRTKKGTIAWENHLSIISTCKKHNIRYFDYILNIFKEIKHPNSLSQLIKEKASA